MKRERSKEREKENKAREIAEWVPKTELGKKVKNGKITNIADIVKSNSVVLEPEIVDYLLPDLEEKMVEFKKTTRVVRAGRKFSFRATVLVGDGNGHVGIGIGKDTEKFPSVKKASRQAKLNLINLRRGCGSWQCSCNLEHSLPYTVEGKSSSVRVTLIPASKGTGLVCSDTIKDVLKMAGVKDVWCKTKGATSTKLNFLKATIDALNQTTRIRHSKEIEKKVTG